MKLITVFINTINYERNQARSDSYKIRLDVTMYYHYLQFIHVLLGISLSLFNSLGINPLQGNSLIDLEHASDTELLGKDSENT